eukprot:3706527-Prymnesium_polylepis.1
MKACKSGSIHARSATHARCSNSVISTRQQNASPSFHSCGAPSEMSSPSDLIGAVLRSSATRYSFAG